MKHSHGPTQSRAAVATDLLLIVSLGAVALLGFRAIFTGWTFFAVSVLGILLGAALGHVGNLLRQPIVVTATLTIAAFFLLGGAIALHGGGLENAVPLPDTLRTLATEGTQGWKELLTTVPPVDGRGPLLVLPYILGLVYAAVATTVAGRARAATLPLVVPVVLLAAVILLGTQDPGELLAQASCFAVLLLAWGMLRSARSAPVVRGGRSRRGRWVSAAGVIALAVAVALPLADRGPGGSNERVVLRTMVEPPYDVGQFPSPLSSFRSFAENKRTPELSLYDEVLLTTKGLPDGTVVRIAALDDYDGMVWRAADQAAGTADAEGTYRKVGSRIPTTATGTTVDAEVRVGARYPGVWLPTVGSMTGVEFAGTAQQDLENQFRYNTATRTGLLTGGVPAGLTYRVRAVLTDQEVLDPATAENLVLASTTVPAGAAADFLQSEALSWGGEADSAVGRLLAIAGHLRDQGHYTNGDQQETVSYGPGHFAARLSQFKEPPMAGNDEQFAALFALLANKAGIPTRVVMGGVLEDGELRGKDVGAWVEIALADGRWLRVPNSLFMDRSKHPDQVQVQEETQTTGLDLPPPQPIQPPSTLGDPARVEQAANRAENGLFEFHLPAWVARLLRWVVTPAVLLALFGSGIVLAKRSRRRRRRVAGSPADRISAAWREYLDTARDLGQARATGLTRREQAAAFGHRSGTELAAVVDSHVFGPLAPDDAAAEAAWAEVDRVRGELLDGLDRRTRLKAALSLTTFRVPVRAVLDRARPRFAVPSLRKAVR